MDYVLWCAVALNLGMAMFNAYRGVRYIRLTDKLIKSPHFRCAWGHDFEHDMITLEDHQPPQFKWTHLHKFTCSRCDFVERINQRQEIYCEGVSEIRTQWLGSEDC